MALCPDGQAQMHPPTPLTCNSSSTAWQIHGLKHKLITRDCGSQPPSCHSPVTNTYLSGKHWTSFHQQAELHNHACPRRYNDTKYWPWRKCTHGVLVDWDNQTAEHTSIHQHTSLPPTYAIYYISFITFHKHAIAKSAIYMPYTQPTPKCLWRITSSTTNMDQYRAKPKGQ